MSELTDEEWRKFQSIPDQGYSHRGWVDARIREREQEIISQLNLMFEGDIRFSYENDHLTALGLHGTSSALVLDPIEHDYLGDS